MFGFFKKRPTQRNHPQTTIPGGAVVQHLVLMQLPLCNLDPSSLCEKVASDEWALGYVFGVADMCNHQFNHETKSEFEALNYIRQAFTLMLGQEGEGPFGMSLGRQSSPEFQAGRDVAATEVGNWIKSQGATIPLGLSLHFRKT